VTPAALILLGDRLEALDVRRLLGRPRATPGPVDQLFWYRWTKVVLRHAVPLGLSVAAVLVVLGLPFLGVKWGYPDDRALPESLSARQVGDALRNDFVNNSEAAVSVVLPDADGVSRGDLERYATELSLAPDVAAVSAPSGTFVAGALVGPPSAPTGQEQGSVFLTVDSTAPLFSDRSDAQLAALHAVGAPAPVEFTGIAQINRDSVDAITARLPLVLGVIAAIMVVLLFLLTGSVVLPLKALVLNVLSLSAAFGAMVWIFQDGHLGGFGTTASGTLIANMPVLLFCIAFGLSMDYEVFLVSRIREYWLASESGLAAQPDSVRAQADNDESIVLGIAHSGRVVTAAALIMSISFAALIAANVAFMRMFGLGLTLAVLVDATLTRMVLVPAFMHVAGRWNWWAPPPLQRLHRRLGLSEGGVTVRPDRLLVPTADRW
jgi:RND superfamily putative drug exporter